MHPAWLDQLPSVESPNTRNDLATINRAREARGLPALIAPEDVVSWGDHWQAQRRFRRRLLLYAVLLSGLAFLGGWIAFGFIR